MTKESKSDVNQCTAWMESEIIPWLISHLFQRVTNLQIIAVVFIRHQFQIGTHILMLN